MALSYGRRSLRVSSNHINQITNTNGTIVSQGDVGGGYQFVWYPLNAGCGGTPNSQFYIELKDTIPWSYITYEFQSIGTSSCWNFNQAAGNMVTFNSSIDRVFNSVNSFENPAYQIKMSACDNEPTNFYRFAGTKSFFVTRRRNNLTTPASIYIDLSCNATGAAAAITIRNIFVW